MAVTLGWLWVAFGFLAFVASDGWESLVGLNALIATAMTGTLLLAGVIHVGESWKAQRLFAWAAASFAMVVFSWETLGMQAHFSHYYTLLAAMGAGGAWTAAYARRSVALWGGILTASLCLVMFVVPWISHFPAVLQTLTMLAVLGLPGWSTWLATVLIRQEPPAPRRTPSRSGPVPAHERRPPDTEAGSVRPRT